MNRICAMLILICIAAISAAMPAAAQQGSPVELTFVVPLNLTRLDSQIPKVRVSCKLFSAAIVQSVNVPGSLQGEKHGFTELPVSQGDAVQTIQVILTFDPTELNNASGKQANYECELQGFINPQLGWKPFCVGCKAGSTGSHLVVTPAPAPITGQFVW